MSEAQTQHDRDSKELRRLCAARDEAKRERDALRAEVKAWKATVWALARELNCLPSTFSDGNEHVLKAAIKLNARLKKAERPQQAQAPGWQPIDETSRERVYQDGRNNYGEFVLVWGPGFDKPRRARWWWREDDQDACNFIADGGFAVFPSVWMPLPAAPQQGSKS